MKYKSVLIGTGRIGFSLGFDSKREQPASHTMALMGNKRIDLVAAADSNEKNLEAWKKYTKGGQTFLTSDELYKAIHPDLITVAVNEDCHKSECLKAIAAKPRLVILEKPVALNSGEAMEIAEFAEKENVPVMVNHERRFSADYLVAKKYLSKIGKIQTVKGYLHSGLRIYGKEFEGDGTYSLLHDGTHLVDIIQFLMDCELGQPVVTGFFSDENEMVRNFEAHFGPEDIMWKCGNLNEENPFSKLSAVSIEMSGRSRFFSFGVDILGTEGKISVGNGYADFYQRKESKLYSGFYSLTKDKSVKIPSKTGYFSNMIQNAVDFLDGNDELKSPLISAIADLKVLEAIKAEF